MSEGEDLLRKYVEDAITEAGFCAVTDDLGNVHVRVPGKTKTIFTSHLDTVHRETELLQDVAFFKEGKDVFAAVADGSCLGADDGTGVWLMLNLIRNKVPGLYCFFVGEECGRVGSEAWVEDNEGLAKLFDRVISFDRKGYHDVVTSQMGQRCTSQAFSDALLKELGFTKSKCNPRGSFTDSYSFMGVVSECTNISVGYFSQHSRAESQNLSFANRLRKRLVNVKWESLPTQRSPQVFESYNYQPVLAPDERNLTYTQVMTLIKTEPELVAAFVKDRNATLKTLESAYERQRAFVEAKAKADRRVELFPPS